MRWVGARSFGPSALPADRSFVSLASAGIPPIKILVPYRKPAEQRRNKSRARNNVGTDEGSMRSEAIPAEAHMTLE